MPPISTFVKISATGASVDSGDI